VENALNINSQPNLKYGKFQKFAVRFKKAYTTLLISGNSENK
jgi:hypothetical protein